MSQYITIQYAGQSESGRTSQWEVIASRGGALLGTIRWFGRWRQYAFFPTAGTLYSSGCLQEVQEFIRAEMAARRNAPNRSPFRVPPEAGE